MLPDLPELKLDLMRLLERYLRGEVYRRMPGLNESPQHQMHEGMRMRVVRGDGTVEENDLMAASAETNIAVAEAAVMSPTERKARLDMMAEDLARQISQHAFGAINRTLEEAGQVVNMGGKPLDAEGILQILDKLVLNFDDQDRPIGMSMVTGPDAHAAAERAFQELESNPEIYARYKELVQRKRMEWRDREASRKLVG